MLAKVHKDDSTKPRKENQLNPVTKLENMTITYYPELALFLQSINYSSETFTVEHCPPNGSRKRIDIPLEPNVERLNIVDISLHTSPTQAYDMGKVINSWFSQILDFEVVLVYLGSNRRPALGNLAPYSPSRKPQAWLSSVKSYMPSLPAPDQDDKPQLSFADCAAYLIVTEESLRNVSSRLPDGLEMDVTKFRPNIVVSGASEAWDEDYWGGISIKNSEQNLNSEPQETEIVLTQNCARCMSLNVDYKTGKFSTGEEGTVLKRLMKDRRVDQGKKYSPIFGRYGFLDPGSSQESKNIAVGDEVVVSKRNAERTIFGG